MIQRDPYWGEIKLDTNTWSFCVVWFCTENACMVWVDKRSKPLSCLGGGNSVVFSEAFHGSMKSRNTFATRRPWQMVKRMSMRRIWTICKDQKILKPNLGLGHVFFSNISLKNMNLPQDVGKKTSPQNGWLTSLGLVSKLQKSEKKKPWGGQIFQPKRPCWKPCWNFETGGFWGGRERETSPNTLSSLSFQKKENQP